MGSPPTVEANLLQLVTRGGVGTVGEVIARMRELDQALPPEDGLKWFNWLYLLVTEEIARDLETGEVGGPAVAGAPGCGVRPAVLRRHRAVAVRSPALPAGLGGDVRAAVQGRGSRASSSGWPA